MSIRLNKTVVGTLLAVSVTPLVAGERPHCDRPEARQFDFWIGEWDVANRHRNPRAPEDRTWHDTGRGTDRVYPVLDGCAIVEHWEGHLVFDHVLGFSVRAWDPEKEAWVILLNWPTQEGPGFTLLEGRFEVRVGRFHREAEAPDGTPVRTRFTFSDITPDALRWEGARSKDGGRTWNEFWIMRFTRREGITDRALLHGPTRHIAPRCDHRRARAFDFLVGAWEGEETLLVDGGERKRPISVESWSILEGCAIMELVAAGEGADATRRFRVRSFVPKESRWVQYTLDRDRPIFDRWRGAQSGDDRMLTIEPQGEGGIIERIRWVPDGADTYRRVTEMSRDGGATWTSVARARMSRRSQPLPTERQGLRASPPTEP